MNLLSLLNRLENVDRRVIYIFVALALSLPPLLGLKLKPAEMASARKAYDVIESLNPDEGIVLISLDWGPNTLAENKPQSEVLIEHLMRRRIPFALMTYYALASPFLDSVPKEVVARLEKENPSEHWEYGKDWVNLGYQPGGSLMIQGLAKSENLLEHLKSDARGTPLETIPCMKNVKSIHNIVALFEVTGLSGVLSSWIQFFQAEGHRPQVIHGCTSISIPEVFIYLLSGQLVGAHEGVAGAAWHDHLLTEKFSSRAETEAIAINTSLSFAQLVILFFIVLGNIALAGSFLVKDKQSPGGHG